MRYTTLLRKKEHQELAGIDFTGEVLDLWGSRKSDYFKIISRQASRVIVINNDKAAEPDIMENIEGKLSVSDESFDVVVAMNLIEHIFEYQNVIHEAHRALKNGGLCVITVPFLFTIHPSPEDYFRYTKSSLRRIFTKVQFSDIVITELGCGVMVARYQLLQNFLPGFVRPVFEALAIIEDALLGFLAKLLGKKYNQEYFPLGCIVTARKK